MPLPRENLEKLFSDAKIAFDLMYGKKCKFLELAKNQNLKIIDGAKMLLYQAIAASGLFLNIEENSIAEAMNEIYTIA